MGEKLCQSFLKVKNPTGADDVHYALLYEGIPPEFEAVAELELKETPSAREKCLRKLKEYMKSKNIPMLEEHLLLAVLRSCKFDSQKSETKLKKFYNTRLELIKHLLPIKMEAIECILDDMVFGMLPYRDKHGRVIFFTQPNGRWDIYNPNEVATIFMVAILFVLSFPLTTVSGIAYIGECKSDSLYMFCSIINAFRKHIFSILNMPVRLPTAEFLNENYLIQYCHRIMKPFFSQKLVDRVHLHGSNYDNFFQKYNPAILPEMFEGSLGKMSNEMYREKLLNFIKNIKKQSS